MNKRTFGKLFSFVVLITLASCKSKVDYLARAESELQQEDYLGAIVEINSLLAQGDSSCKAFQIRASGFRRIQKFRKSIEDLQYAVKKWPDCHEASLELARALSDSGDTAQAFRVLQKISFLTNRTGAEVWIEKSKIHYYQDAFDQSLEELNESIRRDSTYHLSWYYRGYLHSRFFDEDRSAGTSVQRFLDFEQAIADFSKSISLDPEFPDAWFQRGIVYLNQFKPEKGLPDLDQAIKLYPQYSYYYFGRAEYYIREGKFSLAINDLEKAVKLNPEDALAAKALQSAKDSLTANKRVEIFNDFDPFH
jgi:tetratricopeptide (TPR) repeat protein